MAQTTGVTEVAHVIQLAVAPGRLSASAMEIRGLGDDLSTLAKRARLIGRSIALCTITALLICALIAVLFLAAFLRFDASVPVALLFIGAMFTFFVGLVVFLREIFLAIYNLRIGNGGKPIHSQPVLPR